MTEVIVCCDFSHNGDNGGRRGEIAARVVGRIALFPAYTFHRFWNTMAMRGCSGANPQDKGGKAQR